MFTDRSLVEVGARLCPRGIAMANPQHFTVASWPDVHIPGQKLTDPPRRAR